MGKTWDLTSKHSLDSAAEWIRKGSGAIFVLVIRGENMECISRADLARRNAMWSRYPRELALAIQLNGALKRKMRRLASEKQNDGSAQPSV